MDSKLKLMSIIETESVNIIFFLLGLYAHPQYTILYFHSKNFSLDYSNTIFPYMLTATIILSKLFIVHVLEIIECYKNYVRA